MLFLLVASCIWACSFSIIKGNLTGIDPALVAFLRLLITFPIFLAMIRCRGLNCRKIFYLLTLGGIQYGFMFSFYLLTYQYLEAHQIVLLDLTTPIYVLILHNLWNKKFSWVPFWLVLVSIIGAGIALYKPGLSLPIMSKGFVCMQLANACFACGQVMYRRFALQHPHIHHHQIFGFILLGGLVVTALNATLHNSWGHLSSISTAQIYALLYVGIVASGLAFLCWNKGSIQCKPVTLAVCNNLKIPLGVLAAYLFLGEKIMWGRFCIGGSLLLSTIVIVELTQLGKGQEN